MNGNVTIIRTRLEEQQELQRLNNELRLYIQKNRYLELDNDRLKKLVTVLYEDGDVELKNEFNSQLDELRNKLMKSENDKNKALIDADMFKKNHDKLLEIIGDLEKELKKTKERNDVLTNENTFLRSRCLKLEECLTQKDKERDNLKGQLNVLDNQYKELQKRNRDLAEENSKLKDMNKRDDKDLIEENHNLNKKLVDSEKIIKLLENNLKDLKLEIEDLKLKNIDIKDRAEKDNKILLKEIEELKRPRKLNIPDLDPTLFTNMNRKIDDQLKQFREQAEKRIDEYENMLNSKYQNEINSLKENLKNSENLCKQLKTNFDKLDDEYKKSSRDRNHSIEHLRDLEDKLRRKENELSDHYTKYNTDVACKNIRIKELELEFQRLSDDFTKQFDINISLKDELKVYRNLLELEEEKFKFLQNPINNHLVSLSAKCHYCISSSNNIIISQYNGDVIEVFNTSDKEFQFLKGSKLRVSANNYDVIYEFSRDVNVKARCSLKVWKRTNAPNNVDSNTDLYSNTFSWPVGDNMEAILTNHRGEMVAIRRNIRKI